MDKSSIQALMTYYKTCYQADNHSLQVYNFMGKQLQGVKWLSSAELLDGSLSNYPVDSTWGEQKIQRLLLNQKEEELLLGAFFLVGNSRIGFDQNKAQKICAPLLLVPVRLFCEDAIYYLELKDEPNQLNPAIVRLLEQTKPQNSKNSSDNFTSIYDLLTDEMPSDLINFDALFFMEKALKKYYPGLDLQLFNQFPKILSEKEINQHHRKIKTENQFLLLPGVATGLIQKSKAAKGVLDELDTLSQEDTLSAPIQGLFGLSKTKVQNWKEETPIYQAANLSLAQQNVIKAANQYPLSQVTGPPGTGKSFTIAAMAVDAICRGQSVLIATKYDQAADVIVHKIEQDLNLPNIVVRSGQSRSYKKALKSKLQNLLFNIGKRHVREIEVQGLRNKVNDLEKKRKKLEDILLKREENEMLDSQFLQNYSGGLLQVVKRFFIQRKIQRTLPYWEVVNAWERSISDQIHLVQSFAQQYFYWKLQSALFKHRPTFLSLLDELKQKRKGNKSNFTQIVDCQLLFKALPIWVSNTSEVGQLIPLKAELFDLVIIDEASQCDIASALPLLQRGKKAVIVGDPKQLRHLSFLSMKRQRSLQAQYELTKWQGNPILDYRAKSLLDMTNYMIEHPDQLHFLNEHYRSQPDIIHFSNQSFYENSLNIMTMHPHNRSNSNLELHICSGHRTPQGYNTLEAEELLSKLAEIIAGQEAEVSPLTIGILSPFRAQVDYIKKELVKRFSTALIQQHQILVGTPYHFQGEEKDIMLLSMAIDDEAHPATFRYLNRTDVFNVSITRAKLFQHLFLSGDPEKWNKDLLLVQYLDSIRRKTDAPNLTPPKVKDYFATEVESALLEIGYFQVEHLTKIAGFEVDLVVLHEGQSFGIDLVGYPGDLQRAFPPDKHQMLRRIGIPIFVLTHVNWLINPGYCINKLRHFLEQTTDSEILL